MNIFDIAELREQVAYNLQRPDLLSCLRVSKAWHTWFTPALYRQLILTAQQLRDPKKRESMSNDLRRYGVHVRQLTQFCKGSIPADDGTEDPYHFLCDGVASEHCIHLTRVLLYLQSNAKSWQSLLTLFRNNPNLVSVHLEGWESPHVNFGMADLFRHTPNLRHLGLNPLRELSSATIDRILTMCPRLESLTLYSINHIVMTAPNPGSSDTTTGTALVSPSSSTDSPFANVQVEESLGGVTSTLSQLTRLKKLVVSVHYANAAYLPRLLEHCPHVTHLRLTKAWTNWAMKTPATYLADLSPLPTTLISLEVEAIHSFEDEHLATLLQHMPSSLKHIALGDVRAGPQTIEAIVGFHSSTLETLQIKSKGHHILGQSVASILTLCPKLISIHIDGPEQHPLHIPIHELVKAPWACKDLKVFRIAVGVEQPLSSASFPARRERTISHDDLPPKPEEAFYRQLGQLHGLIEISLACRCQGSLDPIRGRMAVSWKLSHGLASLAPLTSLCYLEIEEFPPRSRFATGESGSGSGSGGDNAVSDRLHTDGTLSNRAKSEGAQSLAWMLQHWTKLRQLNCARLTPARLAWIQGQLPHVIVSATRNWRDK